MKKFIVILWKFLCFEEKVVMGEMWGERWLREVLGRVLVLGWCKVRNNEILGKY